MNSCYYKLKNKDKSTERFPPLLSKPTYIFAHAMPRTKNGKQKIPIVMKTRGLCPSISDYSMLATVVTTVLYLLGPADGADQLPVVEVSQQGHRVQAGRQRGVNTTCHTHTSRSHVQKQNIFMIIIIIIIIT